MEQPTGSSTGSPHERTQYITDVLREMARVRSELHLPTLTISDPVLEKLSMDEHMPPE